MLRMIKEEENLYGFENMYVELTKYEYINDKAVLSFFGKTEPNQHDKIREKKLYSIIRG